MKRICLINVGANSSHRHIRSPLLDDCEFELLPIPDTILEYFSYRSATRYYDLETHSGRDLDQFIDSQYLDMCAHHDPEFDTLTYGDYPTDNPRAANLKRISRGDYIFFFARLVRWREGRFTDEAGFFIVGAIEVQYVYRNLVERPSRGVLRNIKRNAHVIRGECNSMFYDGFWVFKGKRGVSKFKHAVPLDKDFVERCGFLDSEGKKWQWDRYPSDLSAIGSYLRAAKLIKDEHRVNTFFELLENRGAL